jgi:CubicO group peptidase (beta-lactamase class C family)
MHLRKHLRALALIPTLLLIGGCTSASQPVLRYGPAEEAGMDAATLDQAAGIYRQAVEEDEIRNVVLLVARRGVVVFHEAIGWRDKENELVLQRDSLFRMASNTKPVVATAVVKLVEEGKLNLHAPVGSYIPSFSDGKSAAITVHHLLTHTSGFRIGTIFLRPLLEESSEHPNAPGLLVEVGRFAEIGPEEEPGTTYSYSNPGFNTLGALVEVASGQPLEDYLRSAIYEPLGMTESLNHESGADHDRMSKVYRFRNDEWSTSWEPGDDPDYPFVRASGGMISTAWDYAIFCQMYLNQGIYNGERVLTLESVQLATTPHTREIYTAEELEEQNSFYGYGWSVSADGVFSHGGSDGTQAIIDPASGLIVLIFTQTPRRADLRAEYLQQVREAINEP